MKLRAVGLCMAAALAMLLIVKACQDRGAQAQRIEDLEEEADSLRAVNERMDTGFAEAVDTFVVYKDRWRDVKKRAPILTLASPLKDSTPKFESDSPPAPPLTVPAIIALADSTIQACEATIAACQAQVAARDALLANRDSVIAVYRRPVAKWFGFLPKPQVGVGVCATARDPLHPDLCLSVTVPLH